MKRPLQIFVRGLGFPTKGEAGLCLVTNVIKRKIMHLHVARTLEMRGRKQLERQKERKSCRVDGEKRRCVITHLL